jgi:hypothetical protein
MTATITQKTPIERKNTMCGIISNKPPVSIDTPTDHGSGIHGARRPMPNTLGPRFILPV